jgi:hypothetical protein
MENNSYYGRMDKLPKAKREASGVHILMLDVHIEKLVDNHIARFRQEIAVAVEAFKKDYLDFIKTSKKQFGRIERDIQEINKQHLAFEASLRKLRIAQAETALAPVPAVEEKQKQSRRKKEITHDE